MANRTHFCVAKQAGGAELIVSALKVKLEEGKQKNNMEPSTEIIQIIFISTFFNRPLSIALVQSLGHTHFRLLYSPKSHYQK